MKTIFFFISIFLASNFLVAQSGNQLFLGDKAPNFVAQSTTGEINFYDDYYGKWKIMFSHPADFTPVCASEILELAYIADDLKKLNTEVIVLSIDGLNSHIDWVRSLEAMNYRDQGNVKINFPIISDTEFEVSMKYGMVRDGNINDRTVRTVFIIDPENKVRAMFYYPDNVGRNIDEIKRTLIALQETDKRDILTPANWVVGGDFMIPAPASIKEADKLKAKNDDKLYNYDWYMWFVRR